MIKADKYYIENLQKLKHEGCVDENPRAKYKDGEPAHSKFITQVFEEYDISKGEFPITTLRNTAIKSGIKEILWIYQKQSNNITDAKNMGVNWWGEWDIGNGTIGQRYGATIKRYGLIDKLLKNLKETPFGRRHIINMYQEIDIVETEGLHPCAYETIWSIRKLDNKTYLDMTLIQRSNDYIMAGYINKIQYVALQLMVAQHMGYVVGRFCHYTHNLHIYDRHTEAMEEILGREPLDIQPTLSLDNNNLGTDFYGVTVGGFVVDGVVGIKNIKSPLELAI